VIFRLKSSWQRYKESCYWHRVFLWFPTRVSEQEIAWLEAFERRRDNHSIRKFEYRRIEQGERDE
jgi:hypothetical protein